MNGIVVEQPVIHGSFLVTSYESVNVTIRKVCGSPCPPGKEKMKGCTLLKYNLIYTLLIPLGKILF